MIDLKNTLSDQLSDLDPLNDESILVELSDLYGRYKKIMDKWFTFEKSEAAHTLLIRDDVTFDQYHSLKASIFAINHLQSRLQKYVSEVEARREAKKSDKKSNNSK